jgi:opacity protein-like surface antigen
MRIQFILLLVLFLPGLQMQAQVADTSGTDLLAELEKETAQKERDQTRYVTATFKTTRLIGGHSSENVAKGVMDVKISHRFGTINRGGYELFGLDNATMRMGIDYGITPYLMVGVGRSTYQKTYDAFFKIKLLRQSTGKRNMPISLSYVPTIALKTLKFENPERKNYFSSRLFYTHQLIIARKFSDNLSLQLMPTLVHRNLVTLESEPNTMAAIGIGGRQKLTKRVSINAEYYYQIPSMKLEGTTNSLSIGFDIETGGHVFQLHFTNSQGMNERTFISETTGKWEKGDILFGFNISRVFTIGKRR